MPDPKPNVFRAQRIANVLRDAVDALRKEFPGAVIHVALADMGEGGDRQVTQAGTGEHPSWLLQVLQAHWQSEVQALAAALQQHKGRPQRIVPPMQ